MLNRFLVIFSFLLFSFTASAEKIQFSIPDINGKLHTATDYKGKWVVVNYWATWCPPCLDEIPELNAFYESHAKDAVVLGVNYEEVEQQHLTKFIDDYFISYPVLKGNLGEPSPFGRVYGLPTTFIISPQGELVKTKVGEVTQKWIEDIISSK